MAGNLFYSIKSGSGADDRWPDPFCDMASLAMPKTIQEALYWSEYIVQANGPYRAALARVVSYFITDVEVVAKNAGARDKRLSREEKQKYLDFLNDTLGIQAALRTAALDLMTYGNSFLSLLVPFRRYLSCPSCGQEMPLGKVYNTPEMAFEWKNFEFHAKCPNCDHQGKWKHVDRRSGESGQIKLKRWSPHEIDIVWDPYTEDTAYVWKIPEDYCRQLRSSKVPLHVLERASWEIVEAVKNRQHLLFDPDVIYHMKEQPLAGVRSRGWGISRVLSNFRQAWYVQVLQRYNEAIALDYIIPFRVITPESRAGQGGEVNDPVMSMNLGTFKNRVNAMLRQRRQDPARWNVLPVPITYQSLGGEATQLMPKDIIELGQSALFDAADVPTDLYRGTLSGPTAPAALRLFEAMWAHLIYSLNKLLEHIVTRVAQLMSWEPAGCRLQRVTHADDLNRQMAQLQLMMGGKLSATTGLASVGADFVEEERRKIEEQRLVAELTADAQEEMEAEAIMDEVAMPQDPAMAGAPPSAPPGAPPAAAPPAPGAPAAPPMGPMGQPMGPGGAGMAFAAGQPLIPNKPTTPDEMMSVANTLAQQAMGMPEAQKDSFLIQLKKEDPTIHALVSSQIEEIRRQAKNEGGQMVLDQQFPKQARIQSPQGRRELLQAMFALVRG